jgi:hypothetical protein
VLRPVRDGVGAVPGAAAAARHGGDVTSRGGSGSGTEPKEPGKQGRHGATKPTPPKPKPPKPKPPKANGPKPKAPKG